MRYVCRNLRDFFWLLLLLVVALFIVWLGSRDTRHRNLVYCEHIPELYVPVFYCADSLNYYMERASRDSSDLEAITIVATAAYNVRAFDKQAFDSLPAIELDKADALLLRAAERGYEPAFVIIRYLDNLKVWHHPIPEANPTFSEDGTLPAPNDPDYTKMVVKK